MKKKIAIICFDNPFVPPMEGGKRGMLSRIEALDKLDCVVDLYLLCKRKEGKTNYFKGYEEKFRCIFQYTMKTAKQSIFSRFPISVSKRYVSECVDELQKHAYDIIIYEGEHVASYRLKDITKASRHILYMHDIESSYRAELARSETRLFLKMAQLMESKRYFAMESKLSLIFDKFLFVSVDERNKYARKYRADANKFIYSPYATNQIVDKVASGGSKTILYVGNLKLHNNYLSLKWFIEEVYKKIIETLPDTKLKVIGDIDTNNKVMLTDLENSVEVCGYVDDIDMEYNEAALVINPVLYGAGVKVKLIDSLARGQIVVANTKAAEGTELVSRKHLILEDNPDKMADACIDILINRIDYLPMAKNGLNYIKSEHSVLHHAEILNQVLEGERE